jgi:hypothetical protein
MAIRKVEGHPATHPQSLVILRERSSRTQGPLHSPMPKFTGSLTALLGSCLVVALVEVLFIFHSRLLTANWRSPAVICFHRTSRSRVMRALFGS